MTKYPNLTLLSSRRSDSAGNISFNTEQIRLRNFSFEELKLSKKVKLQEEPVKVEPEDSPSAQKDNSSNLHKFTKCQ